MREKIILFLIWVTIWLWSDDIIRAFKGNSWAPLIILFTLSLLAVWLDDASKKPLGSPTHGWILLVSGVASYSVLNSPDFVGELSLLRVFHIVLVTWSLMGVLILLVNFFFAVLGLIIARNMWK